MDYKEGKKMKEIYNLLEQYAYFDGKSYEIFPIQKWNKQTKFLLVMENKKYMIIIDEKTINKYQIRFAKFGDFFKNLVGLKYLSEDGKIILLDYYENGEGKTLSAYQTEEIDNNSIAEEIKKTLDSIHEHKSEFLNVSTRFDCQNWYEFIYSYMKGYLDFVLEQKEIAKEDYGFILALLERNKEYFNNVSLSYLHGDVNEENVCFIKEKKEVYLIDYDDFLVGDIVYEYARMFQYLHIKAFKILKEKYYPTIEENIIFWIYIFRNQIMGYCFEKANNIDTKNSLNEFNKTLIRLKKMVNEQ